MMNNNRSLSPPLTRYRRISRSSYKKESRKHRHELRNRCRRFSSVSYYQPHYVCRRRRCRCSSGRPLVACRTAISFGSSSWLESCFRWAYPNIYACIRSSVCLCILCSLSMVMAMPSMLCYCFRRYRCRFVTLDSSGRLSGRMRWRTNICLDRMVFVCSS